VDRHTDHVDTARTLPAAAYGALSAVDAALAAATGGSPRARRFTKPLLMPLLATRTAATGTPGASRTLAAQAFSWGGDVALLGEGRGAFLTGLGSFLGAHVAYVSALRSRSTAPLLATAGRRRLFAAGALLAAGMGAAAARKDRAFALPVAGYGVTLVAMVTAAAAVDADRGRGEVVTGAALFLASDSLLGIGKFLLHERRPALEAAVMATYTAAQWCLAEGLAAGNHRPVTMDR